MTFTEMEKTVFSHKPEFKKIIDEYGNKPVWEYWSNNYVLPQEKYADRIDGLVETIAEIAESRLVNEGGVLVQDYFKKNSFVSTADHHHLLCHPFFLNGNLVQSFVNKKHDLNTVLVLSISGISLDNSSFPRGLFFHNKKLEEERLPFFTLADRHTPVYGLPAYSSKKYTDSKVQKLLDETYFKKDILNLPKYREQATLVNFYSWKKIYGQEKTNLIYLDQESIVGKSIIHLLGSENFIEKLLTDTVHLDAFQKYFDGVIGAFSKDEEKGTFLFWAIKEGKRESLFRNKGTLTTKDGSLQIELTKEGLAEALKQEIIYPSMALGYSILSFYYGLTLGGGFSQVNYLGDIKKAYIKILQELEYREELNKLEKIQTNRFSGELVVTTVGRKGLRKPATLLDILMYCDNDTETNIERRIENMKLSVAISYMMPEYYKIITGTSPELYNKLQLPKPTCVIPKKEKVVCVHCGNAQTNHTIEWINQTILVLTSPLNRIMVRSWLGKLAAKISNSFELYLFYFFRLVKLATFETGEKIRPITERSRLIYEESVRRNIPVTQVYTLGRPSEFFIAKINNKKIVYQSLPRPKHLESDSIFWLDDKLALKNKLQEFSIPVPAGGSFMSWYKIKKAFKNMQKPVIVKPRLGSRGRHTTTYIYTEQELYKAVRIAKQLCQYVIVEEHLLGSVYRATVVGGKVVGILAGDQPKIIGDDMSTIESLIQKKNTEKQDRVGDVVIDPKLIEFIERSGYTLKTILEKGVTLELSEKIGLAYGGSAREISPITHHKIIKTIERAAKVVNDPIIGFDFIIEDPTTDPENQKWGIIEANSLPFINLHYKPMEGPSVDVAPYIWDLWNIK